MTPVRVESEFLRILNLSSKQGVQKVQSSRERVRVCRKISSSISEPTESLVVAMVAPYGLSGCAGRVHWLSGSLDGNYWLT